MDKIRELLAEGKRRRVILKSRQEKTIVELSLTWAVLITLAAPQVAVIIAIAVLLEIISLTFAKIDDATEPKATSASCC